ncbi:hypothetical protein DFP73DRAFT_601527 [Morchella snyderi]|nr:hypothetical protein DFP73DRAFT_601527 [Morchella snyderi]
MGSSLSKPLRLVKNCWRARKSSPLPTATIQQDSYNQQASQELNTVLHEPNTSQFAYHGGTTANPEIPNSLGFLSAPPLPTASLSPIGEERGVYGGETLAPGCLMASTTVPTEPQYGKPPTPLTPSVAATASVGKAPALQEELPPPINGDEPQDAEMLDDITARDIKRSLLWGKAIDSLQKKGLKGLGGGQVEAKAPVDSLIKQVQALRKEVDGKRISYQKADGQDVFIADQIFGQLNKYAFIGDIALQHNPDVAALVWAGFRLLLNIGSAYTENLARILSSLGYLSWVICCGAIYEHIYLHLEQRSIPALEKCLIKQYASILEYLLYAKNHLEQTTGVQIMKSLSSKLAEQLRIIQETEKETKMHADLVDKEAMGLERSKQDRSRTVFERHLRDIRGQLREVETTLSECHANIKRVGQLVDKQIRSTTLDWVSTTQYGKIHSEHYKRRADNTCLWLKTNRKFDNWVSSRSSSSVLWLRGNAGTGKTILASFAIELLKKALPTDGCVAYFYCSINHVDRSSPSSILRALLRQICIAYSHDRLPSVLEELKEKKERGSDDVLTVKESSDLIIELSRQLPSLWIVIDALDECDKDSREDLFDALKAIEHEGEGVRIFVTGRNQGDIIAYMKDYENYLIDPQDSLVDIELYVKSELDKLYKNPTKKGMVDDMKKQEDQILTALLKDIDGMYVSSIID